MVTDVNQYCKRI